MRKLLNFFAITGILLTILYSCSKEEIYTNQIQGKWIVDEASINGLNPYGTGSFFIFMGGVNEGVANLYIANNQIFEKYYYSFNAEGSQMYLNSSIESDSIINLTFSVLELTDKNYSVSSVTPCGILNLRMTRN
jgi:hypothetical protein